jgi:hypothetical protein
MHCRPSPSPSRETASLLEKMAAARRAVIEHKTAIRRHREQLQHHATALAALEAECRRRGIGFHVATKGVGDLHGRHGHT